MRSLASLLFAAAFLAAASPAAEAGLIAFDQTRADGTENLAVVGADGRGYRPITDVGDGHGAEAAGWDPSGRRIFFDSDLAGSVHLFFTTPRGRKPVQITHGTGTEFGARISGDGRSIAYEHENAERTYGGVFVARLAASGPKQRHQLTHSPALAQGGFDAPGDFSPDGSRVAFLRVLSPEAPNARSAVFVVGVDGRGLKQLTPYELNASPPRWSPDGSWLLFDSFYDNFDSTQSANAYAVRPDGTGLRAITSEHDGAQVFSPDWSPAGDRIVYVYAATDLGHAELRTRTLRTGRIKVIFAGRPDIALKNPDWRP